MEKTVDLLIIGSGPAGLSAAINAIARGGSCTVVSNPVDQSPLWKAERIDNYSGMAGTSGPKMLTTMRTEAEAAGVQFVTGRVTAVLPFGDSFMATVGNETLQGRRLLLATGTAPRATMAGEERFLGRGISYCATCDGRFYAGRSVLVTGNAANLAEEAVFLDKVGCRVTVVTRQPLQNLPQTIPQRIAKSVVLWEDSHKLLGLSADSEQIAADGIFILRQVIAPGSLLPGLATEDGYIPVDRQMRTNIPGCYAAGDCTGAPLQIAKAVGEGLIAAQHAIRSLQA